MTVRRTSYAFSYIQLVLAVAIVPILAGLL
jgi:hypothetical protein